MMSQVFTLNTLLGSVHKTLLFAYFSVDGDVLPAPMKLFQVTVGVFNATLLIFPVWHLFCELTGRSEDCCCCISSLAVYRLDAARW